MISRNTAKEIVSFYERIDELEEMIICYENLMSKQGDISIDIKIENKITIFMPLSLLIEPIKSKKKLTEDELKLFRFKILDELK